MPRSSGSTKPPNPNSDEASKRSRKSHGSRGENGLNIGLEPDHDDMNFATATIAAKASGGSLNEDSFLLMAFLRADLR